MTRQATTSGRSTPNELTETEVDRIVELRLNRVPVRVVAEQVGCNKDTVTKYWHRFLDATSEERRDQLERVRSEVIARLDNVAAMARRSAIAARDDQTMDPAARHTAEAKHLSTERQALKDMAGVAGYNAPIRVAASIGHEMTEEEAAAILAELDGGKS